MARTIRVDMTGVESYSKASEGVHTAKVVDIQEKTSNGGDPMLQFAFEVTKGDSKGCRVFESFVLTDKALWKLKQFLMAIGMKAEGKLKIDLDKLIGKMCDIEVFWDEYNGQTRAKISNYYKIGKTEVEDEDEDESDDEEEDEAPAPKKSPAKRTAKAKKPEPEPEDDDEEEDEEEEEEEPAPKKSPKKTTKAPAKKPAAKKKPEPEEDEDDDDDDEWEEDD